MASSSLWWLWTYGVGVLVGSLLSSVALQASIWFANLVVFLRCESLFGSEN